MEVWENEKLKCMGTRARRASVSTLFHECFYNVWERGKSVFYFFYRITHRKLKRGNSLLYQSVNSPYCSRWRMWWRIMAWTFPCFPYSYRNTAFSQSKLAFSKCYFIKYVWRNVQSIWACMCCISPLLDDTSHGRSSENVFNPRQGVEPSSYIWRTNLHVTLL